MLDVHLRCWSWSQKFVEHTSKLAHRNRVAQEHILERVIKFDGQDVEYFVQQFMEIADANGWAPIATCLHLQEALTDGARECGRAGTIPGILAALRARYGLSAREARAQLASLKRDGQTSLQEHAAQV